MGGTGALVQAMVKGQAMEQEQVQELGQVQAVVQVQVQAQVQVLPPKTAKGGSLALFFRKVRLFTDIYRYISHITLAQVYCWSK